MNVKKLAPLAIALILGLIAAKVALNVIAKRQIATNGGAKRPQMVVAKTNIEAGEVLSEDNLSTGEISSEVLPDTAFKTPGELFGRVASVPLLQGQAITTQLLAVKGSGTGLQATLPPGMRAITLEINEFSGVAGFVQPGCRVDILQTFRDDKNGDPTARTIVQNVKVTAVGARRNPNDDNKDTGPGRSVTLLVTPDQAEILELASMSGRPRMSLRGANDLAPISTRGVKLSELVGTDKSDAVARVAAAPTTMPSMAMWNSTTRPVEESSWTMQIVRGGASSDIKFMLPHGETEANLKDIQGN
jgi:pilus assembly protein CpaB